MRIPFRFLENQRFMFDHTFDEADTNDEVYRCPRGRNVHFLLSCPRTRAEGRVVRFVTRACTR